MWREPHIKIEGLSRIDREAVKSLVRLFSESTKRVCGEPLRSGTIDRISVRTIREDRAFRNAQGALVLGGWDQPSRTLYLFYEQIAAARYKHPNLRWDDIALHELGHSFFSQVTDFSVHPSDHPESSTATSKEAFSHWLEAVARHAGNTLNVTKELGQQFSGSRHELLFSSSTDYDYPSPDAVASDAAQLHYVSQQYRFDRVKALLLTADACLKKKGSRQRNYDHFSEAAAQITGRQLDEMAEDAHLWFSQQMRRW